MRPKHAIGLPLPSVLGIGGRCRYLQDVINTVIKTELPK